MNKVCQVQTLTFGKRVLGTFVSPVRLFRPFPQATPFVNKRSFSCSTAKMQNDRPLKLMNFPKYAHPGLFTRMKNTWLEYFVKGKFDETFTRDGFIDGAIHVITQVSEIISAGHFDQLSEYMDEEAVDEIKYNCHMMNEQQQRDLLIKEENIFQAFIHSIDIKGRSDGAYMLNVVVVLFTSPIDAKGSIETWGSKPPMDIFKSAMSIMEKGLVVNGLFSKELSKDFESDWNIKKLNFFKTAEVGLIKFKQKNDE